MPDALGLRCQLSALLDRFEAFSNDPGASSRLLADASAWQQAADKELLHGVEGLEVHHIALIVDALYRAGTRLAALDSLADGRFPHVAAAAVVVESCLSLAVQLQSSITPKRALRLLQCLTLLLSSGAHWLRSGMIPAGAESGGGPAEPLMRLVQAVNRAVVAASCCWPTCVDGLAASIVTPRLLLSWLAAVGEAVRQLNGEHAGTGAQAMARLSAVLHLVCRHPAFGQHAEQLAQDAALCSSLTRLFIAAYCTAADSLQEQTGAAQASEGGLQQWCTATDLATALAEAVFRSPIEDLTQAAAGCDSSAAALLARQLEASAQLLQLAASAGAAACLDHSTVCLLARQLGMAAWRCYLSVRWRQEALPGNPAPDGRQELEQARVLLPAVPIIVRLLQAEWGKVASGADGAAGAEVVATLANALAGVLRHLQLATLCTDIAGGSSTSSSTSSSAGSSSEGSTSGSAGSSSEGSSSGETSLDLWCEATCAALRALPVLADALPLAGGTEAVAISKLAEQICSFASDAARVCLLLPAAQQRPVPAAPGALAPNQQSLWRLHTATTRACHWLSSRGLQQLRSLRPRAPSMITATALPLVACSVLLQSHAGGMGPALLKRTRRALSAMAAAHFEALHALVSALQPSDLHGAGTSDEPPMAAITMGNALGLGPACLQGDPRLLDLFRILVPPGARVLEHVWPGLDGPGASTPAERTGLLHISQWHARTAALLLTTPGMLDEDAIDRLLREDRLNAVPLVNMLSFSMEEATAASTARPGDDLSLAQAVAAAHTQLADALHRSLPHMMAGRGRQADMPRLARGLKACLPAARRLATALQAWYARSSQQHADQLELATAAAVRSCAYLRCANLGGEDGPAAGDGAGSKRCSACRAVWYCGTACQHADWRAGHKLVCTALGTRREERKEQRRQAAGAAAQ